MYPHLASIISWLSFLSVPSHIFLNSRLFPDTSFYLQKFQYVPLKNYVPLFLASPVAQMIKNLPAMQGTWVRSLGQEDALEKGMAAHCSILAWKIPWTEEPGGLLSTGSQSVGHNWTQSHKRTNYCSCVNCFLPLLWLFCSSFFLAVFHKDLVGFFWGNDILWFFSLYHF